MDTTAWGRARRMPSRTGSSRACSCSALTLGAKPEAAELPAREPGRVLSAPRSRMSAPSSSNSSACATADSGSRKAPPSLNESGVRLTMPITSVRRPSSSVRLRNCQGVISRGKVVIRKIPCCSMVLGRLTGMQSLKGFRPGRFLCGNLNPIPWLPRKTSSITATILKSFRGT